MQYSLFDFLQLIGSLGIFIYGMKIMSEGIQKAAGNKLREILRGMTSNRITGIFTGFLTTSAIQSSSATTVMVVSFVNAGLLTLSESLGVIMGANIGTTVTAWIVAYLGFKVQITPIAVISIGLFFPFLFMNKPRMRNVAEFVIGFGILFIGLDFLKGSVPDIKENPEILEFVNQFTHFGFGSTIIFILIGTLLTVVVQSSSAATAITITLLSQGWIDLPIAAAMVLGENIGTTITANIAAIVANVHAKRAARFHFVFNIIGVIWMMFAIPLVLQGILQMGIDDTKLELAAFHSTFNVINVLLLVGFVPFIEKWVIKMVPSRGDEDEGFRLQYIGTGLMNTAELSISEANKEIQEFVRLVEKISYSFNTLLMENPKRPEKLVKKIKDRETNTDQLELEIAAYLTKISEQTLSKESSGRVRSMLRMINDLERIADIYVQMVRNYERMHEAGVSLPKDAEVELEEMLELCYAAVKLMRENYKKEKMDIDLNESMALEKKINKTRDRILLSHYERLERGAYSVRSGVIFLDFINRAEKVGDHVVNVNECIVGAK